MHYKWNDLFKFKLINITVIKSWCWCILANDYVSVFLHSCPIIVSSILFMCYKLVQFIYLFTGLVLSGTSLPQKYQYVLARWGTTLSKHVMVMVMMIIIILWQGTKVSFKLSNLCIESIVIAILYTHTRKCICFFLKDTKHFIKIMKRD